MPLCDVCLIPTLLGCILRVLALPLIEELQLGKTCVEEVRGGTTGRTCLLQRRSILGSVAVGAIEDAPSTQGDQGPKETMNEQNEWLAEVNLYRCMHGATPLLWSEVMSANVRAWIDGLSMPRHSDSYHHDSPLGPSGENLACGQDTIARAVYDWYSEVAYCSSLPGCEEGISGAATGHFTALIWRSSKELGCARSARTGFFACRFRGGRDLGGGTLNLTVAHLENVQPKSHEMQSCLATVAGEVPRDFVRADQGLEESSTTAGA